MKKGILSIFAAAAVVLTATLALSGAGNGFRGAFSANAASTELNIASGSVNITEAGDYVITGDSSHNNITVDCQGEVNITFKNLNLSSGSSTDMLNANKTRFNIVNGRVNLELDGTNLVQTHQDCGKTPAVHMSDSAELHIYDNDGDGGNIKCHGSSNYYGGGAGVNGGSLYIHSGSVCLVGGAKVESSYGKSFDGKTLDIEGGALTFSAGGSDSAVNGNITVSERLHIGSGITLNVTSGSSIEIAQGAAAENEGTLINDGAITNKSPIFNSGTITNNATIDCSNGYILNTGNGTVNGSGTVNGNQPFKYGTAFTVTGSGLVYGTDYTYPADTGVLTVLSDKPITIANVDPNTSTNNRIEVASGVNASITLAGVNIDVSANPEAAFKIADNSTANVTVTLATGSVNTLKSGWCCAGLQKNGTIGTLEITGTGTLNATGGIYGAGIGGGDDGNGSNITISDGTVIATGVGGGAGGDSGAGIGGGRNGNGSNITISGGTVTATGGAFSAGIGGGSYGSGSDITISGGAVAAQGGYHGAGIGGGEYGSGMNIKTYGGSVKATAGDDANAIGGGNGGNGAVIPTNEDGDAVYLFELDKASSSLKIDSTVYPIAHVDSNGNGEDKVYVYLTEGNHTVNRDGVLTVLYFSSVGKMLQIPKASDFIFTTPSDLTYTGTVKTAEVKWNNSITCGGDITVKYFNSNDTEVTQDGDFVCGEYTVKIDVAQGTNYAAATDITDPNWKFTITNATPTIAWSTAAQELPYTGSAAVITAPAVTLVNNEQFDGTISYSYKMDGETDYTDGLPTNAGVYKVMAHIAAFGDYGAADSADLTLTINQAQGTLTVPTSPINKTFGDANFVLNCTANSGGTISYSSDNENIATVSSDGTVSIKGAGNADITVTLLETENYSGTTATIGVVVTKAENAPNKPSAEMNVARSCEKVSDVTLPNGWQWQDADKDKPLESGVELQATAEYFGADKDYYENLTTVVKITRSNCDHAHTEIRNAKDATCKTEGYTGDTYCTDCETIISTGSVIRKTAHLHTEIVNAKDATCTTEGYTGDTYCTDCETIISAGSVIQKTAHLHTEIRNAKDATCTTEGYTGNTYCKDCGEKIMSGTSIPATGHKWQLTSETPATYTSEGKRVYTCSVCKQTREETIPKLTRPSGGGSSDDDSKPDTPDTPVHPDDKVPFIRDDYGNSGWDAIGTIIDEANDGDTVTVDMNGSTVVPDSIFEKLKDKNVTAEFDIGDGIIWSVNGKDIISDNLKDIDFGVKPNTMNIPIDIVNNITGERYNIQITLVYDGEFGFKATLSINLGKESAGQKATLYHYNSGELEFVDECTIAADGTAQLEFTHASDYLIVIGESKPDEGDTSNTSDTSETSDTSTSEGDTSSSSGDTSSGSEDTSSDNSGVTSSSDSTGEDNPITGVAVAAPFAAVIMATAIVAIVKSRKKK